MRRDIAVVDDTHRGDTEATQGEESQQHEVFIQRYVREGRKLKIKKSSKGMCAFKVVPQMLCTHEFFFHRHTKKTTFIQVHRIVTSSPHS